ncbi:caspase family protein [Microvirga sp. 0TCS3.31]
MAERRVALVIGNGTYESLKPLRNPVNDAGDVASALKALGFEVMQGVNLNQLSMKDTLARFTRAAREADVSLFYYAGHGFQISSQNFLAPVDASLKTKDDVRHQTIDLRAILREFEGSPGVHLVFLDACRNNPLAASTDAAAGLKDGLARIRNATGFLIAFATQEDKVAFDGGGRNSPFTQAVLSHMNTRGQDIASMMIAVRKDVIASTGGFQAPVEDVSLTSQFYFAPGSTVSASPETQLWQLAASTKDPELFRIYLDRYPEGAHVADVRALLNREVTTTASRSSDPARSAPSAENLSEETLWELVRRSRMRSLVEFYLARNPQGRYASEARDLLMALPKAGSIDEPSEVACERLATHPRDATANTAGVLFTELAKNADAAIVACRKAAAAHPEMPHYIALLARAMAASNHRDEAVRLYRDAAERGNLRAMVSLALILETGDGLPKDVKGAITLYERAAAAGSPDAAVNLAVALIKGAGIKRDVKRAVDLLERASRDGSAIATYNLGVLTQDGIAGAPSAALGYFQKAADLGDPRGYLAAAILLDEGRGVAKNPSEAARMLLQGVATDSGEALSQITLRSSNWAKETVRAVQSHLKQSGYYSGPITGQGSPAFSTALRRWRNVGLLELNNGG